MLAADLVCPECHGSVVEADDEVVCGACGFVLPQTTFDSGPERAYDPEQRIQRSRTGAPATLTIHDKGLSTLIGSSRGPLSSDKQAELFSLRKWQGRVRVSDATERNLAVALSEMSKLAASLSLPKNILETASVIYRRAIRKRLIRGRSIQNVAAGAIYMACRQCQVPRTLDDVAAVASGSDKK